jgi:hypothetical protein
MKLYFARPFTNYSYTEITDYYHNNIPKLESAGYKVLCPMAVKRELKDQGDKPIGKLGYKFPETTNHAIYERDKWMVTHLCDVLLCDLSIKADAIIGCTSELIWSSFTNKHTVLVLPKDSPHYHAFLLESADIVFETLEEAIEYLINLIKSNY